MRSPRLLILVLLIVTAIPKSLGAKGRTLSITIATPEQVQPIRIKDPAVAQFHIWEGPGVTINGGQQTAGFIVVWGKGIAERRPNGLRRYQVSFYINTQSILRGNEGAWFVATKTSQDYIASIK